MHGQQCATLGELLLQLIQSSRIGGVSSNAFSNEFRFVRTRLDQRPLCRILLAADRETNLLLLSSCSAVDSGLSTGLFALSPLIWSTYCSHGRRRQESVHNITAENRGGGWGFQRGRGTARHVVKRDPPRVFFEHLFPSAVALSMLGMGAEQTEYEDSRDSGGQAHRSRGFCSCGKV